jgi:hypothetical protein
MKIKVQTIAETLEPEPAAESEDVTELSRAEVKPRVKPAPDVNAAVTDAVGSSPPLDDVGSSPVKRLNAPQMDLQLWLDRDTYANFDETLKEWQDAAKATESTEPTTAVTSEKSPGVANADVQPLSTPFLTPETDDFADVFASDDLETQKLLREALSIGAARGVIHYAIDCYWRTESMPIGMRWREIALKCLRSAIASKRERWTLPMAEPSE